MNDEVVDRLDRLIAIVSLAFADQIEQARERVRANPVSACILERASDWTPAGELQKHVAAKKGLSARRVRVKLAELVALGAVATRGAGPTTAYKTTGLI